VGGLVVCGGSIGCHLCDGRVCGTATRARDACVVMVDLQRVHGGRVCSYVRPLPSVEMCKTWSRWQKSSLKVAEARHKREVDHQVAAGQQL
jgi:hypothetical protein